jgi:hypothetical protein
MSIQYIYDVNGYLCGAYDGPGTHADSTLVVPPVNSGRCPQFIDGSWRTASALELLTPMTLYMAFKPAERIAIKASVDPMVKEFWAMYQLSVQLEKPTDPNLVSVQEALAYLAAPASPGPGGGILASADRVAQILAGIPQ